MADGTVTLVDGRGRKNLTAKERERFLAAARAHPKPGVPLPTTIAAVLGHASLTTTATCTTAFGAEARELVSRVRV